MRVFWALGISWGKTWLFFSACQQSLGYVLGSSTSAWSDVSQTGMVQELNFYSAYSSADSLFLTLFRIPDHSTFRSDMRTQPSLKMSWLFPHLSTTVHGRERNQRPVFLLFNSQLLLQLNEEPIFIKLLQKGGSSWGYFRTKDYVRPSVSLTCSFTSPIIFFQ